MEMPILDGEGACKKMRRILNFEKSFKPIICALSSNSFSKDKVMQLEKLGFDLVTEKPL